MIKYLLGLLYRIATYYSNLMLKDAGRDEEKARNSRKILDNVKKAQDASNRADDGIIKRLRKRYNL